MEYNYLDHIYLESNKSQLCGDSIITSRDTICYWEQYTHYITRDDISFGSGLLFSIQIYILCIHSSIITSFSNTLTRHLRTRINPPVAEGKGTPGAVDSSIISSSLVLQMIPFNTPSAFLKFPSTNAYTLAIPIRIWTIKQLLSLNTPLPYYYFNNIVIE